MDTSLPQKFPFILDRNLAKANCTGNRACTSCDTVVLHKRKYFQHRAQPTQACTSRPLHFPNSYYNMAENVAF